MLAKRCSQSSTHCCVPCRPPKSPQPSTLRVVVLSRRFLNVLPKPCQPSLMFGVTITGAFDT